MSLCVVCGANAARIRDGKCRDCGTPRSAPRIAAPKAYPECPRCGGPKKYNVCGLCLDCYEDTR